MSRPNQNWVFQKFCYSRLGAVMYSGLLVGIVQAALIYPGLFLTLVGFVVSYCEDS